MMNVTEQMRTWMNRWRWPLVLVVATALLMTWLELSANRPQRSQTGPAPLKVRVQHAAPEALRPSLRLYGRVETPQQAELTAALSAYVEQVAVREGDPVDADALLVALDTRDVRLLLAQREADLSDARARLAAEAARHAADLEALKQEQQLLSIAQRAVARQQSLLARNLSSQAQLDEARRAEAQQALVVINRERDIADHDNRRAQLQAAELRAQALVDSAGLELERSQSRAPFAGRVATVSVAVGERLRVGDALLSLYPDDQLELRVQIPSRLLPKLRAAMQAEIAPEAHLLAEGGRLALVLDRLAAEVQQGRGGVDAFFRLRQDDDRLALEVGRAVEVEVLLPPEPDVIALPSNALYGSERIYRVQEGRLQALRVERIGQRPGPAGTEVLVRSRALAAGDAILLTRVPNAISGMPVMAEVPAAEHEAVAPEIAPVASEVTP